VIIESNHAQTHQVENDYTKNNYTISIRFLLLLRELVNVIILRSELLYEYLRGCHSEYHA